MAKARRNNEGLRSMFYIPDDIDELSDLFRSILERNKGKGLDIMYAYTIGLNMAEMRMEQEEKSDDNAFP